MQKILVIGGTNFIGQNLVARLIEQNKFEIHLFNRGKTNPTLFPQLPKIIGDRNTDDVKKLQAIEWDFVIDLSCYFPDSIRKILAHLPSSVKRYIFISSVSAYQLQEGQLHPETSLALKSCDEEQEQDPTDQSYGNRKAGCEGILENAAIDHIIFRPALIYGAFDPTDRLYYWLYQVKFKDQILIPEKGEGFISLSYVQDVVDLICQAVKIKEHRQTYNLVTSQEVSIRQIIDLACKILNRSPQLVNVTTEVFQQHQLKQWVDIPLWVQGDWWTYSNKKLQADFACNFLPLFDSIEATIQYYDQLDWPIPNYGLSEEKRMEIIQQLSS